MGQTSENLELFHDSGLEGRGFRLRFHLGADVRLGPWVSPSKMRQVYERSAARADLIERVVRESAPELAAWLDSLPRRYGWCPYQGLGRSMRAFKDALQ